MAFVQGSTCATTPEPVDIAVSDFNGDGVPDVVTADEASGLIRDGHITGTRLAASKAPASSR